MSPKTNSTGVLQVLHKMWCTTTVIQDNILVSNEYCCRKQNNCVFKKQLL